MVIAIIAAFYEQSKPQANIWVTTIALVVFMFGMMWLSSKTPSKNKDEDGKDI